MDYIFYDDAPADTAASRWLRTKLGQRTIESAVASPGDALRRAFRAGFLIKAKAELEEAGKGGEWDGL